MSCAALSRTATRTLRAPSSSLSSSPLWLLRRQLSSISTSTSTNTNTTSLPSTSLATRTPAFSCRFRSSRRCRWMSSKNEDVIGGGDEKETKPEQEEVVPVAAVEEVVLVVEEEQPAGTANVTFATEMDDNDKILGNIDQTHNHDIDSLAGNVEDYTLAIPIRMPDMGEGNDNLLEIWYKKEGDVIHRNDVLCDITTPDFTFGMVTDDEEDAIMGEIHVSAGTMAPDNAPICTIYHSSSSSTSSSEQKSSENE